MTRPWYALTGEARAAAKLADEQARKALAVEDANAEWIKVGRYADLSIWRKGRRVAMSGASKIKHEFTDPASRRLAILLARTVRLEAPRGIVAEMPESDWQFVILRRGRRRTCCLSDRAHSLELAILELFGRTIKEPQ